MTPEDRIRELEQELAALEEARLNGNRLLSERTAERDAAQAGEAEAWEALDVARAELARVREALDDALTTVALYTSVQPGMGLAQLEERLQRALAEMAEPT
jgi:hypothetical protein